MTVEQALGMLSPTWTVFHDLRQPGTSRVRIDHLVIGPTGVFVVDATGSAGTAGVRDATLAIASLVPALPADAFLPVLCLPEEAGVVLGRPGRFGDVLVCVATTLVACLTSRPRILSEQWLEFLQFELDMTTRAA